MKNQAEYDPTPQFLPSSRPLSIVAILFPVRETVLRQPKRVFELVPTREWRVVQQLLLARGSSAESIQPTVELVEELLGGCAISGYHIPRVRRIRWHMIKLGFRKTFYGRVYQRPFFRPYADAVDSPFVGEVTADSEFLRAWSAMQAWHERVPLRPRHARDAGQF